MRFLLYRKHYKDMHCICIEVVQHGEIMCFVPRIRSSATTLFPLRNTEPKLKNNMIKNA